MTRFAAGTATFNRESRRISREEVGTSCYSPLASARAAGRRRSTSHRSPAHCLPTAWPFPPFSRNEPDSRPELQPLTGKGEESAGRRSVQAASRRSRAPAQQEGSGRRRGAHFGAQTVPTASRCPARQPQRARFAAGTATINRERWKSIREEVGTSRSSPPTSARTAGRQRSTSRRLSSAQPYPLLAAARQPTRFAAGTATINRERWKSIREEVGTSRSSPLARARAAGRPAVDVATPSPAPSPFPPTHRPPLRRNRKTLQHARRRGLWARRVVLKSVGCFRACIRCASSAVGALRAAAFFSF